MELILNMSQPSGMSGLRLCSWLHICILGIGLLRKGCLSSKHPDILAEVLKKSRLSLWGSLIHKPSATWSWKTPAETTWVNWKHNISDLPSLIALLWLSTSGTLGINCWPLFNFLNCKNYGPKVQWIGRGKLLCLWASFPISSKSTNKSNISIYISWGLCIREAKHIPAAPRRWLHGQISVQVMRQSLPDGARGNNQSRWTRDIKNNTRNFTRKRAPAQTVTDLLEVVFVWFSSGPGDDCVLGEVLRSYPTYVLTFNDQGPEGQPGLLCSPGWGSTQHYPLTPDAAGV